MCPYISTFSWIMTSAILFILITPCPKYVKNYYFRLVLHCLKGVVS
jgi:hypothetical protein